MSDTTVPPGPADLTRAAGLARLAGALPRLGADYTARRNHAPPPGAPPTTSLLSPWLRLRLLTEPEVVAAVTAAHGPAADKFVQEIFWRTYFKGHLEQHPELWRDYKFGLSDAQESLAGNKGMARLYAEAIGGTTGLACLDSWARELTQTGWLHNHVRMWFASIWIFSLGLPWQLGADFFAHHLLDHDPASNTLSWRWVAGLHTRGKPYVARAENIARYTGGRFTPTGLEEAPTPLSEPDPAPATALPASSAWPAHATALLVHEDDLAPESLVPDHVNIVRVGILASPSEASATVRAARATALHDAGVRAEAAFAVPVTHLARAGDIAAWAEGAPIATPYAPVGPVADALAGLELYRVQRAWDQHHWPHCARGFFQLRAKVG
jgi:deoxyribodipyrimidine photo-lyase